MPILLRGSGLGSVSPARLLKAVAELFDACTTFTPPLATVTVPLSTVTTAWLSQEKGKRTVFLISPGGL
ncbi:hypothetical protein KTAU_11830 [Thermogemmatispora aurantia]|uniref:Uncharacterized protein n=1 Tax=Thermogemmatispora aurantia TaxID=2045279 RepID=A0A5J4K8T0_9CHLR|nr:hypothetical protein KTAU_11830 [Thermogemmatispora aurantia]